MYFGPAHGQAREFAREIDAHTAPFVHTQQWDGVYKVQ
jgi:hypothetical protein